MKIEIGESLLFSWLKHIKECQIVQTNWKASDKWELKNSEKIENLMKSASEQFLQKYNYEIFKGSRSIGQVIGQAEVDVLGIHIELEENTIYAVDVAFHEAGLNYGSRDETVSRVIKKCIRTAICINGYLGYDTGHIIFAAPKINPAEEIDIQKCMDEIHQVMENCGMHFDVRIIGNQDFNESILKPLLNILGDVADTSELFIRSLQMYNMFAKEKPSPAPRNLTEPLRKVSSELAFVQSTDISGYDEMKIGVIVRTVLRRMLEEGKASNDEIERMQTREYSKETFDIQYPLLLKVTNTSGQRPIRYYAEPVRIYGVDYYLCSEWFEVSSNNDKPYLFKWIAYHNKQVVFL